MRDALSERASRLRWRFGATIADELPREQRRELAEACLRIVPELSDRRVARMVGLSHQTVGRLRSGLDHPSAVGNGSVEPNVGDVGESRVHSGAMAVIERERETVRLSFAPTLTRPAPLSRPRREGSAAAVYASTGAEPEPHFIGWLADVDSDELFAAGEVYGVTVRRVCGPPSRGPR